MGLNAAARQARFRARQLEAGNVSISLFVPAASVAELRLIAEALRASQHLLLGPLRDAATGRLVSAKSILRMHQK
jgi:hypothetical protein